MNYKDAVKVFVTIIIILNRAESELVARISQRDEPTVGKDHRLYCEVGNPNSAVSRQYKWKINNKKITNSKRFVLYDRSLTIKRIKKRDRNKVIQCQVDQSEFSTKVVLNPRYGPDSVMVHVYSQQQQQQQQQRQYNAIEGRTFGSINCTADCFPICSYKWRFRSNQDDKYKTIEKSSVLNINVIKRNNTGSYMCVVNNTKLNKKKTEKISINVHYGPVNVLLSNFDTNINTNMRVKEGTLLRGIKCSAECGIHCEYKWYKGFHHIATSQIILDKIVDQSDKGNYTCYVENRKTGPTKASKSFVLNILHVPSITYVRLNSQYRRTSNNNLEIKKGGALELECKVDSVPAANITLRKSDNKEILTSVSNMSYLFYSKKESECEDLGKYTCEAENGIGERVYKSINVLVRCPPYLTPQKRRKINSTYSKRLGSNVMFTTEVKGYPPVKAKWFYKYNHTTEEIFINPTENNISSVDGVFSLYIGNITEENFGIFVIELRNEEGNLSFTFALENPKTMVLAPDNMGSTNNNRSGLGSFIGGVVAGIALLCIVVIALVVILMKKRQKSQKELSTEPREFSRESSGHFDEDDNHHSDTDGEVRTNDCGNMAERKANKNTTYALNSNSNIQDSGGKVHRKYNYTYAQVQKSRKTGGPNELNFEVYGNNSDKNLKVQKQTITEELLPSSGEKVLENDQELYSIVKKRQTKDKPCTDEQHNDRPTSKQQREGGKITKKKGADRKSKPKHESQSLNYIEVEFQSPASETSKYIIHGAENRTLYSLVDFTKHAEPLPESQIQDDNGDEPKFKTTEECSEC